MDLLKRTTGADLESSFKKASRELDQLTISAVRKHQFKEEMTKIQKAMMETEKARQAEQTKAAIDKLSDALQDEKRQIIVAQLDGVDSKTLSNVITHIKTKSTKAALLISVDPSQQRVSHVCHVPKDLVGRGLAAKDWAAAVAEKVGGKAGGKAESAQGSGTEVGHVKEALDIAEQFAQLKLQ